MVFNDEPTQYKKTILSDLQGVWQNLRDEVVNQWPFPDCQRIMFHIDEGMSWESVRNLEHMRATVVLLQNIVAKSDTPKEISEWLANVWDTLSQRLPAESR